LCKKATPAAAPKMNVAKCFALTMTIGSFKVDDRKVKNPQT